MPLRGRYLQRQAHGATSGRAPAWTRIPSRQPWRTMTWRAPPTPYLPRFDRFPRLLIAVTTAVLLLAVAPSVVAYLSPAQTLTTPSPAASFQPPYLRTPSN